MKQKLQNLFFLFLLGTIGAKAQGPVITADSTEPYIGENLKWQFCQIFYPSANDSGGANRVWDYSNLKDSNILEPISIISPVGLPHTDSFPTANIAIEYLQYEFPNYEYDMINSSTWGGVGYVDTVLGVDGGSGGWYTANFKPLYCEMHYPLTYMDTYTDSSQLLSDGGSAGTIYDTLIADGYGTLKLPTGTYTNVLRVQHYKNNITGGGFLYFQNGVHFPLLTINPHSINNKNGVYRVTSWSAEYYAGTSLPIEISSFTATWQNKMPYLQWDAANTENTKAFNIQRSVDGHSFSTVGQVGVSGGSSYHFEDTYIPTSTVYYRLQQVDKNGQTFYSSTAQLTVNSKQLTVYPNPSKGTIHVSVPSGNAVHLLIYDAIGRLVYENKTYSSAQPIATDSWGKGTYLVRVKDNEGWKVSSFEIN